MRQRGNVAWKYPGLLGYFLDRIAGFSSKEGKRLIAVLSKYFGPVGQSDISYECPTKNVRVPDQISDRKYKNIHFMDENK